MPTNWIIVTTTVCIGLVWVLLRPAIQQRLRERKCGKELSDPFTAEVLYEDETIADLSDREFVEMFWRHYRIEPRSPEAKEIIENDELWDECVFDFRDPVSGDICTSGFVGGTKPFVRDGKVTLRALYFGGSASKTKPESAKNGD